MARPLASRYFCIALLVALAGCKSTEWKKADVTAVQPSETIHLRVLHAVNPRFPRLSQEQLHTLLKTTQQTVQQHFGVTIEFTELHETSIDRLFARLPAAIRDSASLAIYDFKSGNGDRRKLAAGICTTFKQRGTTLEDALAFARPYLPTNTIAKDMPEFCGALAAVMLDRLEYWRKVKAADGEPVLDATPYNEWVFWDALGYSELPYDVVITNQLIASAEYVDVDVHSAIRGGITVGTTSYSRNSRYGAYAFWSTFPFTDASANTTLLRGGEEYSADEAAKLSGAYLAHEMGHVLFQFGHPFGHRACVMNPVSMLRFREWYSQIDARSCAIGSQPEMLPGAIPVYFNSHWQRMSQGQ